MTTDELDLMQLASTGQKLARVDDVDYLSVHVVLAWPAEGAPTLYCPYVAWPKTPVARLVERDKEIAELEGTLSRQAAESLKQFQRASAAEARIRELEAQITALAPRETPAQNQARMFQAQAAALDDDPGAPGAGPCPDCGRDDFKNARALQMHRQRTHQGMVAVRKAPEQFVEDLGWRCAAKGCSGAHARSIADPAFCTLHAQAEHANGHEMTA